MTTKSGHSAFAEVNELVAHAGEILKLKKGLVGRLKKENSFLNPIPKDNAVLFELILFAQNARMILGKLC